MGFEDEVEQSLGGPWQIFRLEVELYYTTGKMTPADVAMTEKISAEILEFTRPAKSEDDAKL
jgi:hypothetical protein